MRGQLITSLQEVSGNKLKTEFAGTSSVLVKLLLMHTRESFQNDFTAGTGNISVTRPAQSVGSINQRWSCTTKGLLCLST